ncbi:MAG TPA: hypothetical protein VET23_14320 [Chitinophagaceae bacterium]|nr:hypothetical protein [Chitinophagaceae bacterium]
METCLPDRQIRTKAVLYFVADTNAGKEELAYRQADINIHRLCFMKQVLIVGDFLRTTMMIYSLVVGVEFYG